MRLLIPMLIAALAVLESGCTTLADARQARGTGVARVFDVQPPAVWAALPSVLKEVGLDYVGENRQEGYALAQRGITPFSYGENVAIFLDELTQPSRTRVEVVSKKAMETNIFAPNWSNDVLDKLAQALGSRGATLPPPPSPSASTPASTSGRKIDDVDAVPLLDERGRKGYREFLTKAAPRAFLISEDGRWLATWGTRPQDKAEPANPSERAMARCQQRGWKNCRLYAVDDRVVWD